MKGWEPLTERGRYRRLRSLAWEALDEYDVLPTGLRLVGGFTNVVFRVETERGPLALRIDLHQDHME